MVQAQAQNMKSGWKSIFAVLSFAATDTNGTMATPPRFVSKSLEAG